MNSLKRFAVRDVQNWALHHEIWHSINSVGATIPVGYLMWAGRIYRCQKFWLTYPLTFEQLLGAKKSSFSGCTYVSERKLFTIACCFTASASV
jgi:hypothetical protein